MIEREYTIACQYTREEQNVFSDDHFLRDNDSNMVAWRVGEVVTTTRDISPMLTA